MIIDRILDRYDAEQFGDFSYNAHDFYMEIFGYGRIGDGITRAMDGGTEEDTQKALAEYVRKNEYNPRIIEWIYQRVWNENTNEQKPIVAIL